LANLEAGKILGGTPFVMKTRVPTKLEFTEGPFGGPIAKEVYDDAVDYILPKKTMQFKLNFDNITNSIPE
jgi:hypothetical protein